ncbi:MAG: tetratricopeptide repeat protein [Cytophagales bacterium]|nr:tetratricopeptide repeat protein [Cytophagales bacterium]
MDSAKSTALVVSESTNRPYFKALSSYLLGHTQDIGNDKISALVSYLAALETLSELDTVDLYLELNVRKSLGVLLKEYHHFEHAIEFYKEALPFAEQYSKREQASLWYNQGNAYKKMDSLDKAMICYDRSFALAQDDQKKRFQIYNQQGLLQKNKGDLENAKASFMKIIEMENTISPDLSIYLGKAYHNLANVLALEERYTEAIDNFHSALKYKRGHSQFITYKDLGEVYFLVGDRSEALLVLEKAKSLYPKVSLHPDNFGLFKLMSTVFPETTSKHLQYYKQYTTELERYQRESEEIKELAARGYVGSMVSHYLNEMKEIQQRRAQFWLVGMFLAGIISTLLVLLGWQSWKKRGLSKKVGSLNGTINDIEATLTEAIKATERHSS